MSMQAPTDTATGALVLDAEALYRELLRGVRLIRSPQTHLVGITSGGAWLAQRLQADLQLPGKAGVVSSAMHRDDFYKAGECLAGDHLTDKTIESRELI